MTHKGRLYVLDFFKLVASYFVVFIHCQFSNDLGIVFKALARFAVPFFFLCSGYFLYGNDANKIKRKASHILRLFLLSYLVFFLYYVLLFILRGRITELTEWLHGLVNYKQLIKFLMFNVPYVSVHLWFLAALVYVYFIHFWIAKKHVSDVFLYLISVFLLILHLLVWQIILTLNPEPQSFVVRNFLFTGLPFVGIGMMIKKYSDGLPKLSTPKLIALITLGSLASVLSRYALGDKTISGGSTLVAVSLLIYAVQHRGTFCPTILAKSASLSTIIYIIHPIVIDLVGYLSKAVRISSESTIWINTKPLLVCIITTILAVLLNDLSHRYKRLQVKKRK